MRRWLTQRRSSEGFARKDESDFRERGSGLQEGALRGGSLRQICGVGMLLRNAEEYNLSEEQEEQLQKMQTDFELEKVDLLAALRKAKIVFRALIREPDSAETDVMHAIDRVAASEADLRKMRYRHLKAAQSLLNDEQRHNLKTVYRQRMRDKFNAIRLAHRGLSQ
jgi:hypothetical protein